MLWIYTNNEAIELITVKKINIASIVICTPHFYWCSSLNTMINYVNYVDYVNYVNSRQGEYSQEWKSRIFKFSGTEDPSAE